MVRLSRVVLCCVFALSTLCACSGTFNSIKGSLFGGERGAEKTVEMDGSKPAIYYVGAAGLVLYQEPGKTVVTRLPLHQKVYRYRLERGYAYVKVDGSGQVGWLDNAKLIWRLPRATAPAPAATPAGSAETAPPPVVDATAPSPVDDSSPPAAAAEAPSSANAPAEATPAVSPSVFEPF